MVFNFVDHALYLSSDNATSKRLVSNSHPRSVFISSIRPSASSFSMEIRSWRGIGSCWANGRPTMWMAKGTAALARGVIVGSSRDMVVVSSMYTSAFAQQSIGGETIVCKAVANGMESSMYLSVGIVC